MSAENLSMTACRVSKSTTKTGGPTVTTEDAEAANVTL